MRPEIQKKIKIQSRKYKKYQKYDHKGGGRRRPPSYFWYFFCIFGSGFVFFLYFRTHLPIFSLFFRYFFRIRAVSPCSARIRTCIFTPILRLALRGIFSVFFYCISFFLPFLGLCQVPGILILEMLLKCEIFDKPKLSKTAPKWVQTGRIRMKTTKICRKSRQNLDFQVEKCVVWVVFG